jgi:ABC-type bacteriocin/lantibiotic exporter with double-glycine peptidase domain
VSNTESLVNKIASDSANISVVRRFLNHFKPYRMQAILGISLIPVSVVFSILFPWMIMQVIDQQLVPAQYDGLMWWAAGLIAVLVGNYIADAAYNFSLMSAAQCAMLIDSTNAVSVMPTTTGTRPATWLQTRWMTVWRRR